ncbi:hypothetical protein [Halorubellus litoreus]|uniref:Uncharacterized protein n=1 Tax=Halorubellus litoreus TaxID=755308 RepID=A0ABD5V6Y4_9EURY
MRRRALLATVGSTVPASLAGCALLGPEREVGAGDVVELDAGEVTLGELSVQSSFVDDTTAPAAVHGDAGTAYVVLDCDLRAYNAPIEDLPLAVERGADRLAGAAGALASGAGDGQPRIAFPVPAGDALDGFDAPSTTTGGDSGSAWRVVLTDADDRERRYPLDRALQRRLRSPPAWRVAVDPPDAVPEAGTARAWATATNAGDTPGRLAALLTHDAATDLYWTHEFDADVGGESTFGFRFGCLCGDRDELELTLDWGQDAWTGTVPVET